MKDLVILGAGSAGTMMANHLNKHLDKNQWNIHIIDETREKLLSTWIFLYHLAPINLKMWSNPYQNLSPGVQFTREKINKIEASKNLVELQNGKTVSYDVLIIATGSDIAPEEIEGMKGSEWHKSVYDFIPLKVQWH